MTRRIAGLLEFGGTAKRPIRPTNVKALKLGPNWYVSRVTRPRTYRAQRFMQSAADDKLRAFDEEVAGKLAGELQRRLGSGRGSGSIE